MSGNGASFAPGRNRNEAQGRPGPSGSGKLHVGIGAGLVGRDRYRSVQPHALDRFAKKGPRCLGIPSRRQAEVDHLSVRIDGAP